MKKQQSDIDSSGNQSDGRIKEIVRKSNKKDLTKVHLLEQLFLPSSEDGWHSEKEKIFERVHRQKINKN